MECNMDILVLASNIVNLGDKYAELWDMLDGAKDAGVTWEKSRIEGARTEGYDAYIYIDTNAEYLGKPFIHIDSLEDDNDSIASKVQELASYMFGKKEWVDPPWINNNTPESEKLAVSNSAIDIVDLGYEITEEEVARFKCTEVVINIEGKDVCLGKSDLIVMGKIANLVDKFGYKIKKVVV